ncbi:MAG: EamA family transporter [Terrimesophilobacter sp.]
MVGYLGAIVTFAGFIVWFWGLRTVPAAQARALMFLQPVSGLALSALLLGNAWSTLPARSTCAPLGSSHEDNV